MKCDGKDGSAAGIRPLVEPLPDAAFISTMEDRDPQTLTKSEGLRTIAILLRAAERNNTDYLSWCADRLRRWVVGIDAIEPCDDDEFDRDFLRAMGIKGWRRA